MAEGIGNRKSLSLYQRATARGNVRKKGEIKRVIKLGGNMKRQEIEKIKQMRLNGATPTDIARKLNMSVNTIKSHIRRHPIIPPEPKCLWCGVPVVQPEGRKQKKFCSDRCRMQYWNNRRKEESTHERRKAV